MFFNVEVIQIGHMVTRETPTIKSARNEAIGLNR